MYPVLTKRRNFIRIWKKGRHFYTPSFILQVIGVKSLGLDSVAVGITCSSKVGNAVVRNRVKRRFRCMIRAHFSAFRESCAYVIIAKVGIEALPFANIEKDFVRLLRKIKENSNVA